MRLANPRTVVWVTLLALGGLAGACVGLFFYGAAGSSRAFSELFATADGCEGCRKARPGSGIRRGGAIIAGITQIAGPDEPRRSLTGYLVETRGAVIDSGRAGYLVGLIEPDRSMQDRPLITLVPKDSAAGLRQVAFLVTGDSGAIPVYAVGHQ